MKKIPHRRRNRVNDCNRAVEMSTIAMANMSSSLRSIGLRQRQTPPTKPKIKVMLLPGYQWESLDSLLFLSRS
jgi:hypothetical protein